MELRNNFSVAAPIDQAWKVLLDVERVATCMPGATLEGSEGDEFNGHVKVKVGPIVVTYKGTAKFVELDQANHRAVIDASGKESRGSGTAKATITTLLEGSGDNTEVTVVTDLNITGRPAQFGRGVIADVASKLTDTFAQNLAAELARDSGAPDTADVPKAGSSPPPPAEAAASKAPETVVGPTASPAEGSDGRTVSKASRNDDVIDLLGMSASPVLKRLAPIMAGAGLLGLLTLLRRRRRRAR